MNHYPKLPVSIFRLSPVSVAHGAEGFEDFGDVGGVGAGETFGHGFGGDEIDWWHLMVFQRRGLNGFVPVKAAPLKK